MTPHIWLASKGSCKPVGFFRIAGMRPTAWHAIPYRDIGFTSIMQGWSWGSSPRRFALRFPAVAPNPQTLSLTVLLRLWIPQFEKG